MLDADQQVALSQNRPAGLIRVDGKWRGSAADGSHCLSS